MRDDGRKWDAPPDDDAPVVAEGLRLTHIIPARQTLISAPDVLSRFHAVGWPEVATGAACALCLRRDRVLEVDGPPRNEGWDGRQAMTEVTDAYAVIQIEGPRALALCRRGTELSLSHPSRSVARQIFGLPVFLYRWQAEDRFRLHTPRGHGQALWQTLAAHMQQMRP